jgi:cytochrome c556
MSMNVKRAWMMSAIALAGCAQTATQPLTPTPAFETANVIAARQAGFALSAPLFSGMKAAIDRGQAPKTQAFAAKSLAKWGATLPLLFPAGSTAPNSRAKPDIWLNRADFDARAAGYAAATAALAAAAESDDRAAFTAQWTATQKQCAACHSAYRAEAPRS